MTVQIGKSVPETLDGKLVPIVGRSPVGRFPGISIRGISTFFITLLLCTSLVGQDTFYIDDQRTLLYPGSDGEIVSLSIQDMIDRLGLETLEVFDLEFRRPKTFEGVSLRALLNEIGLEPGEQLVFVAVDGYQISFDSSLLDQTDLNGLLAFRDLESQDDLNWELFQHGRDLVNFDPFYLVWAVEAEDLANADTERLFALPWPYQMNEIRIADTAQYLAAAPAEEADARIQSGFDLYVKHCIKCHQVKGVGGLLGPAIDRENSWAALIETELLMQMIWKIYDYIPQTKMPDYRETLSAQDAENLVLYMQHMQ